MDLIWCIPSWQTDLDGLFTIVFLPPSTPDFQLKVSPLVFNWFWAFTVDLDLLLNLNANLASKNPPGASWGRPRAVLEDSWAVLPVSWTVLKPSWGVLKTSWGVLEASWSVLDAPRNHQDGPIGPGGGAVWMPQAPGTLVIYGVLYKPILDLCSVVVGVCAEGMRRIYIYIYIYVKKIVLVI